MELLSSSGVVEDNIDISGLMVKFGLNPINKYKHILEKRDLSAIADSYSDLVSNCNNCHKLSDHNFVVITQPTTPVYDNQDYTGVHSTLKNNN